VKDVKRRPGKRKKNNIGKENINELRERWKPRNLTVPSKPDGDERNAAGSQRIK